MNWPRPFLRIFSCSALCALCASVAIPPAFAQGCALCNTTAKAAGNAGIRAINHGILTLLIPTLLLFVGVLVFAVRRAHSSE